MVTPEGDNPGDEAKDRAQARVATASMANSLIMDTILLTSERQSGKRGGLKIGNRAREKVEGAGADPEFNVTKTEEGVEGLIWKAEVLARPEQKIEGEDEAFSCHQRLRGLLLIGEINRLGEQGKGKGFDSGGWVIRFGPRLI